GEIERDERPGRVGRDGTDRVDGGVARVERGRAGHRNGAADVARAYLARARGPGARRRERGAHVAAPAAVAVVVLDVDAGGPARGERGLADARPRLARLVRAAGRRARGVEAALRVLRARVERGALADVRRARAVRVRVARAGAGAGAALVRARARRSGVPRRAPVALHTARLDAQAAASRRRVRARVRARRRRRRVEAPLRVLTAPVERRATGARGARRLARGIHVAHARGRPRAAASRAGLVRSARLRRAPRACRAARLDAARAPLLWKAAALAVDVRLAAGVSEGAVLAGKYRVERVLGVGGMGVVVAARHLDLDYKVAIKFLLPALFDDHESVARFAREARAAVKITSEHVARVLDVGTLENGAPYMVMEFLEGEDLSGWLRSRGPLPVD